MKNFSWIMNFLVAVWFLWLGAFVFQGFEAQVMLGFSICICILGRLELGTK